LATVGAMSKKKLGFLMASCVVMVTLVAASSLGQPSPKNNLYRYLSIFTEVFSLVRSSYVDGVAPDQLVEGAFSGVTDAVDEFSYYVPPAEMRLYQGFKEDEVNGVGLVVTKRYGYAFVISALEGSEAAVAGVKSGDFIEAVNGKLTQKMPIWQIRTAIRGGAGKTVDLKILRGGMTKRDEVTIKRGPFDAPDPTPRYVGDIAIIKVPFFEKDAASKFAKALQTVKESGKKKLIVDLRGNAGGSILEAIAAVDHLLASGVITSLQGRRVEQKRWTADPQLSFEGDVQVLTDSTTAAGAEIFAAAIHGNKRGKITGTSTFGKAGFQKFVQLPSGGGLNMTIGYYTTPELKAIKEQGVRPDTVVDLSAAAIKDESAGETEPDLIMIKALELFAEKKERAAA